MATEVYPLNRLLIVTASIIPQPNIIVSNYEWTINNNLLTDNNDSISINTNSLFIGNNTISLRVKNSCGSWSEYITKTIYILPEEIIRIYAKDRPIKLVAIIIKTGTIDNIITNYEWKINDIIQSTNNNILNINTNNLLVGINIISLRIKNSCGLWSDITLRPIEVYPSVYKTFNININNTTVNKTVII